MQINLNQDQAKALKALFEGGNHNGDSIATYAGRVFNQGLYQFNYRKQRNVKQAERQKEMRALYRRAQADPELAAKLGLGTISEG